ncbi:MAG: cytochrome c biogenesis protein ResB [Propioniciclava sp.]|uniref:cytochrome c biogenesis protein ResB n=1 Tax=Propioniciclava sp. TaxID=2038686 RepID=UPI0039E4D88F
MATLRWLWTQLTSMRTALILLLILALVAIPGSMLPQRPVAPIRVSDWKEANPALADLYEAVGLFDVYGSPWFAAVYLLLLVSLVGCIIPRIGVYARALRMPPPRTPKRLDRLPASATGTTGVDAETALAAGEAYLRGKRFRTRRTGDSVAAERGRLREFGNIVFHLAFVFALGGVAWNQLASYTGDVIVVEGQAFSNNLTQYDDFRAGAAFTPSALEPVTVWVDRFTAKFETGEVQRGAARVFRADVRWAGADGEVRAQSVEVNQPLRVGRTQIHLTGHGYAPVVEVKDPHGDLAFSGPVVFLPQDGNFTSMGVIKVPDARPRFIAFEGFFLPTTIVDDQGPRSVFPDALSPSMFVNVWTGPPREETGRPESVYSLSKAGLEQMTTPEGVPVTFKIEPGEYVELPDGSTLTFTDWKRWTKLQVSENPGQWLIIAGVGLAVAGMTVSLYVRPRRMWLRVRRGADGVLVVEAGGLDRAEASSGLAEAVAALAASAGVTDAGLRGTDENEPDDDQDDQEDAS